ncbi:MAG: sigma-70 family RNA polymerase sigma factor [Lachnospiraceae bacterium]|nr:sigma-70 family RNA polymerase sigma factor [Lachnospiraceae bacterium]
MTYSFDDYSSFTDEELISRLRSGEEHIMEYLLEKYKKLVLSKAKSMFILGGDTQDLVQEGMIGLFKAIRDFDEKKDASFMTFTD